MWGPICRIGKRSYVGGANLSLEAKGPPNLDVWRRATSTITTFGPKKLPRRPWPADGKRLLRSVFRALDRNGAIGNLVLDAGASIPSLAYKYSLQGTTSRVVCAMDVGFDNSLYFQYPLPQKPLLVYFGGDLHNLKEALDENNQLREALSVQSLPLFNTILLSDILNYVDFKSVIKNLVENYLLPGGRVIISNMAGVVYDLSVVHPEGVKTNIELLNFLATTLASEDRPKIFEIIDRIYFNEFIPKDKQAERPSNTTQILGSPLAFESAAYHEDIWDFACVYRGNLGERLVIVLRKPPISLNTPSES